jgi:hypothetical protein
MFVSAGEFDTAYKRIKEDALKVPTATYLPHAHRSSVIVSTSF